MAVFFGLDFGTSNSALSVNINGTVRLLDIDEHNPSGSTMKSILYFDEDDKVKHSDAFTSVAFGLGLSGLN
jgi:hypothetical chaperone protein